MKRSLDGGAGDFFAFVDEYQALIQSKVPGNYHFEYDSRLYMLPVLEHLEAVVAATPPGGRILDLGCGRGHYSAYLALRGFQAVGIEVADPAPGDDVLDNQDHSTLAYYPGLWAQARVDYGCDCGYFDGVHLPAPDASFNTVLFYATFEHVPVEQIHTVTAEAFRVLKPGGRAFVFRCPTKWAWKEHVAAALKLGAHKKRYGKSEILGILRGAGFRVEQFSRSDLFPAYVGPLQRAADSAAPFLLALEKLLRWTPLALVYHHFEIEVRKP